ncbi:Oidioi.mRNA.OKI2018_I69.chr2.g4465.t1.cds [Oikopleura dioica]|uniref:Oidioi.mRNA.OKI2018_I69.chr2.g4465.t1.cds n=1 Tax=Oikopleura dioica TaxID=34765 RepID=A0ABN7T187_OIKDI|nr:Oidioi.mRNA.OKI2018_I69.chr2.g4465.t1.cds [Oikopleura dioica]
MSLYRAKDYILVKLHELQETFEQRQEFYEFEEEKSPVNLTVNLLQEDFPVTEETEVEIAGHARLLCVAGKVNMCFIDEFVIRKQYRAQGLGKHLWKSLEEFLKLEIDQDFCGTATKDETARSFFHHMGMNKLEKGEKLAYIDIHEGELLNKLSDFFSVAKEAMARKKDAEMLFLTKDLIHFDLCGTDGYKERIQLIKEAQEKLEAEIMEKAVGSNYKKMSADTSTHAGIEKMAEKFGGASRRASSVSNLSDAELEREALLALTSKDTLGRRMSVKSHRRESLMKESIDE